MPRSRSSAPISSTTASGTFPVIAFTGFAMGHDRIRAVDVGFDLYIPKPAEPKVVLQEVRRLLGLPS
jgi:CheY-like chemotaxis protein